MYDWVLQDIGDGSVDIVRYATIIGTSYAMRERNRNPRQLHVLSNHAVLLSITGSFRYAIR